MLARKKGKEGAGKLLSQELDIAVLVLSFAELFMEGSEL